MGSMRKSRIGRYGQNRLNFVSDSTARTAGLMVGVNKTIAAYYYHWLREIIVAGLSLASDEVFAGGMEVDESYFGGGRKGKRGRGAASKIPVFGSLKRGGKGLYEGHSRCFLGDPDADC